MHRIYLYETQLSIKLFEPWIRDESDVFFIELYAIALHLEKSWL